MISSLSRLGALGLLVLPSLLVLSTTGSAQQRPLRVFISADMEGVAGIVDLTQVRQNGSDYENSRTLLTGEVNAAIQGAFDAGATEVVVNDSHGTHTNLLPEQLDSRAVLIRGRPKLFGMVQGLDSTFGAVVLVGYHARATTMNAILDHTYSLNIRGVRINGTELGEFGLSAAVAGYHRVPVVFVSGDQAVAHEAKLLIPRIEVAVVKEAIGRTAARSVHPSVARSRITAGVRTGIANRAHVPAFVVKAPVAVEFEMDDPGLADALVFVPNMRRLGDARVGYSAPDMLSAYVLSRLAANLARGAADAARP